MSDILSLQEASIGAQCKTLRLPTIGAHFLKIAEQATREGRHAAFALSNGSTAATRVAAGAVSRRSRKRSRR